MAIRILRHTLGAGVLATGLLTAHVQAEPPAHAGGKAHHAEGKQADAPAKGHREDKPVPTRAELKQARGAKPEHPAGKPEPPGKPDSPPEYAAAEAKRAAEEAQRAVMAAARAARLEAKASLKETKKAIHEAAKAAREAGHEAFLASKRVADDVQRAAEAAGKEAAAQAKAAGESAEEQSAAAERTIKEAMAAADAKLREARQALREQLRAARWDALKARLAGEEVDEKEEHEGAEEGVTEEDSPDVPPAVTQELRRHAMFMARLTRARELAEGAKDKKSLKRIDALTEKEIERHSHKLAKAMGTGKDDEDDDDGEEEEGTP